MALFQYDWSNVLASADTHFRAVYLVSGCLYVSFFCCGKPVPRTLDDVNAWIDMDANCSSCDVRVPISLDTELLKRLLKLRGGAVATMPGHASSLTHQSLEKNLAFVFVSICEWGGGGGAPNGLYQVVPRSIPEYRRTK